MSADALAAAAVAVAVAGFVQGTTGMGFALILAPILAFVAPQLVPVGLLVLMIPLNVYVAWRERAALDRLGAGWITAGRVLGTFGGVWILAVLSVRHLDLLIGLSTILAAFASLAAPRFTPARNAYVAAGIVTGVTETATGIGGPPLALVLQHADPPALRSTIAFCFLVGEIVSLAFLAASAQATAAQFEAAAVLLPALAAGAFLSHRVHARVNGRLLRRFVLGFAIVSGIVLLWRH
ncbi:MAG: sulfite exporter TauE/SafE family protein [Proteobacteria bacterium]|jgi:uncharacterized membrane protein YfcA|nr:sulfite exporter TauE/SafE family protein [Pseudomonadota bacterium]